MSTVATIRRKGHPRQAVSYFKGSRTKTNWIPAIVWLYVLLVGVVFLRQGNAPQGSEWVSLGIGAGGVVLVGAFAPAVVSALLIALLIGGALGAVPQVPAFLGRIQGAVTSIGRAQ